MGCFGAKVVADRAEASHWPCTWPSWPTRCWSTWTHNGPPGTGGGPGRAMYRRWWKPTRASSGPAAIVREARASLKGYGLPVARAIVTQRVALGHALIDGLAIHEFAPTSKAAREVSALWRWIAGQLRRTDKPKGK